MNNSSYEKECLQANRRLVREYTVVLFHLHRRAVSLTNMCAAAGGPQCSCYGIAGEGTVLQRQQHGHQVVLAISTHRHVRKLGFLGRTRLLQPVACVQQTYYTCYTCLG